ncbi:MAG TPA: hypothetical protein VMH37_11775 [Candidatus Binataceae bacterium]|nr:hypothetical protein [Candidatus Binataceae bacterium]
MGLLDWAASHRVIGSRIVSALPDFALAGFFGVTWLEPTAFGLHSLARCEQIMLMEFIIVHSSAFLGFAMTAPRRRDLRVLSVVGLGVLYSLFVGSFALVFHNWWLLGSFWMLLLNRIMSILLGPRPQDGDLDFIVVGWATAVVCYLGFVFLTAFANIPRFGISAAAVAAQSIPGGGIWADQPWRVVAFGTFYYAAIGVTELFGLGAPPASSESPSWSTASKK